MKDIDVEEDDKCIPNVAVTVVVLLDDIVSHGAQHKRTSQPMKLTSSALLIKLKGRSVMTFLEKSNAASPELVWENAVTAIGCGHEMMDVRKMPMRRAPLTRYSIRKTVRILQNRKRRQ